MRCLFTRGHVGLMIGLVGAVGLACTPPGNQFLDSCNPTIVLTSTAFADGTPIPVAYTADGDDVLLPLAWTNLPSGTVELALIMDDPDAPGDTAYVHWVLYGLSPEVTGLPQGVPAEAAPDVLAGAVQGTHSDGGIGYVGPAPPEDDDAHQYRIMIYALDTQLGSASGLSAAALRARIDGHTLACGVLTGTYDR